MCGVCGAFLCSSFLLPVVPREGYALSLSFPGYLHLYFSVLDWTAILTTWRLKLGFMDAPSSIILYTLPATFTCSVGIEVLYLTHPKINIETHI